MSKDIIYKDDAIAICKRFASAKYRVPYLEQAFDAIPAIEQIPKDIVEQAGNGNVIMSEETYDELIEGSIRRKKGSWIYYGKPIPATSDHYGADCSECGAYSEYLDNFCGNCGADMRGEEQ